MYIVPFIIPLIKISYTKFCFLIFRINKLDEFLRNEIHILILIRKNFLIYLLKWINKEDFYFKEVK